MRRHLGVSWRAQAAAQVRRAMAMPSWFFRSGGTFEATAPSQRLTKTEATERTSASRPAAMRRSMPRSHASAAARYCSREKSRVTFTGMPAKVASSMAGSPSLVPGILMWRFLRPARARGPSPPPACWPCRRRAAGRPPGRRSRPRPPSARGRPGRGRPPGRGRRAPGRRRGPRRCPGLQPGLDGQVVGGALLQRLVEDGRVGGEPGDRKLVDVALQGPGRQQVPGHVVEPDALAGVVESLRRLHRSPRWGRR